MKTTHLILALVILLILGGGAYWLTQNGTTTEVVREAVDTMPVEPDNGIGDGAEPLDELLVEEDVEDTLTFASETTIGSSVNGAEIAAHHFGNGTNEVVLITGVHGADSANTVTLGGELIDYLTKNEDVVPENMRVTVIPTVNPDGLENNSRFNTNDVDLNRNFGCDWAATSQWRDQEVSGGTAAYSEPEAAAVRDYIEEVNVVGAVVWFAAEGKVYPSACEGNPSTESLNLAGAFADASGYGVEKEFNAYQINGDMTNWLADEGIPAISVLLTDRENTEWEKNEKGVRAVLELLSSN